MSRAELFKRYLVLAAGLALSAAGIALITKAGLGTSPISSVPYVLSFIVPLSFGQWTFIINMLMMLAQIALLGRQFPPVQLMQIPMTIFFSFIIDLVMALVGDAGPELYPAKCALLLGGCLVLGAGIALQIVADVVVLSGEGLVRAISVKVKKHFGTVKTIFDLSLVASSILISLAFLFRIEGLREGTLLSALVTGTIARFFIGRFSFLHRLFRPENDAAPAGSALR